MRLVAFFMLIKEIVCKQGFIFLLCVLFPFGSFAQFASNPVFQHLPAEKFGVNRSSSQQWDKLGRVWMVCENGLLVYDGYSSKKILFKEHDKNGLVDRDIREIFLDSQENLWISYQFKSGFSKLNINSFKLKNYLPDSTKKNSIPDFLVSRFMEGYNKKLFLTFWGGGIAEFDIKTEQFVQYTTDPKGVDTQNFIPFNVCKTIAQVDKDNLLVAFFGESNPNAFPGYFNTKTKKFKKFPLDEFLKGIDEREKKSILISLTIVNQVHIDKNNNIWFATYCGLIYFDMKNKTCRRISPRKFDGTNLNLENARGLVEDADGVLWVATPNKGVLVANINTLEAQYLQHSVNSPSSIADNRITSIRKDPDQNIWISTGSGTVSLYCKFTQQFKVFPWSVMDLDYTVHSEQTIPVNQLLVRKEGEIFVSNENGISVFDGKSSVVRYKIQKSEKLKLSEGEINTFRIQSFKLISEDEILLDKAGQGYIYSIKTKKFTKIHYPNNFPRKIWVSGILFRHHPYKDRIFITKIGPNYLFEYNHKTGKIDSVLSMRNYSDPKDFENGVKFLDNFSTILPDGKIIFSATVGRRVPEYFGRLIVYDPTTKKGLLYGPKNCDRYFPDSLLTNIYLDPTNKLWIGSENGVYLFDVKSNAATYMSEKIGLPKGPVRSIITDKKGIMWFALEKYVARWNPLTNSLLIYRNELGMPTGTFLPAVAQMDEFGKIYIATTNGLLSFDPAKLTVPDQKPEIRLSFMAIKDDTLSQEELLSFAKGDVELTWNQNFFTFEFATNQVYVPVPHQFYYRLVGLDTAWQINESSNRIRYTNLSYGNYTLEVKVKNVYNITSNVLKIPIQIRRPFWLAWWFYVICVAVITGFIFLYIRYREAKLRRTQELLERKVEERTAEVVEKAREITLQKEIIEEKNKELTDSIHYAERIQRSILPDVNMMNAGLPNHFVLFKPKDIVSGDFYWYTKHENHVLWAVVDCTGHGVPGGFMSMLGSGLLNQIVNEEKKFDPAQILNELRDRVIIALKQTGTIGENRDGMDISLCSYNVTTNELSFAGANNAAYVVREGELHELSPDKQPIGIYVGEKKNFSTKVFSLKKSDCIYMTSDGYPDQFGGPKGKKFKTSNFEKLVQQISPKSLYEQLTEVEKTFMDWKSDFEQLDDVCVFGVKI